MIYLVKVFVNREIVLVITCMTLDNALMIANMNEDNDYICEIEAYDYHKTLSREFWRDAKTDEEEN